MSDRPSTSKARGVCSFFQSRRGCRNGESCKFIHGEGDTLSPYDKGKVCKFYITGFCKRDDRCWFRHPGSTSAAPEITTDIDPSTEPVSEADEDDYELMCSICQEKPITYGLLDCSHVFCLKCIKSWRDPAGKSTDIVESGNIKKCPYCRTPSKFVTPSSRFYPTGDYMKTAVIAKYRDSMARIQCKFFDRSPPGARRCPFGRDCFYQHKEIDGSLYVFSHGADYYMNSPNYRNRLRNATFSDLFPNIEPMRSDNDVLETLAELRSRFEAMHRSTREDTPNNGNNEESFLSRLVEDVLISLEDSLIGTVTSVSEDEHIEESHSPPSRPSILATLEDSANTSALPLTRALMDFNTLSDNSEPLAIDEESTDNDIPYEDSASQTGLPPIPHRRGNLVDLTNLFAYIPAEVSEARNDVDEESTSNIDIQTYGREEVSPGRSHRPVNPEPEHVHSDTVFNVRLEETDRPTSPEPFIPPISSLGPADMDGNRSSLGIDIVDTRDDLQPESEDRDSRSKSEARSELSPRRTKSSSGPGSCGTRRNGGQSFFTDGRGRVVGTDDGVYTDAGSLAFWAPDPLATIPPPISIDQTSITALGDHGSIDDMD